VILLLVERMLFVKKRTELAHVHAFQSTLGILIVIASLNVLQIQIVIILKLVLTENAEIPARECAVTMQNAMLSTIARCANV
jgi:hypothetical protein